MGIFSKLKNRTNSSSDFSQFGNQEHETSIEDKAHIIVEFVQDYKYSGEYDEFFDYSDLAIPLAIALTQDMADLTESGLEIFEETWSQLCALFDVDEAASYESIEDLMDNESIPEEYIQSPSQTSEQRPSMAHISESALANQGSLSNSQIIEGLQQIFEEVTGMQIQVSDFDKRLSGDLGIDSLALVEGLMAVEDMFGLSITNEDAFKLDSLTAAVSYISVNGGKS